MRKEYWCWILVGLFTVMVMGVMTGLGIRDGDWGVSVAGLIVCSICFVLQMYNIVRLVENTTKVETLMEMREWLHGYIKESESQEETCDAGRPEEGET